jgi:hypothetical protein
VSTAKSVWRHGHKISFYFRNSSIQEIIHRDLGGQEVKTVEAAKREELTNLGAVQVVPLSKKRRGVTHKI